MVVARQLETPSGRIIGDLWRHPEIVGKLKNPDRVDRSAGPGTGAPIGTDRSSSMELGVGLDRLTLSHHALAP